MRHGGGTEQDQGAGGGAQRVEAFAGRRLSAHEPQQRAAAEYPYDRSDSIWTADSAAISPTAPSLSPPA